jgi:predicted nuclease with TOPRIM domain
MEAPRYVTLSRYLTLNIKRLRGAPMTIEIHDKLIALLTKVDELKTKEAELKSEKQRHLEQIVQSEGELSRCNDELSDIRESQLRLKREMDGLRDELFAREEEEDIVIDDAQVVTDGENRQADSEAKRAWDARAKHLKTVR